MQGSRLKPLKPITDLFSLLKPGERLAVCGEGASALREVIFGQSFTGPAATHTSVSNLLGKFNIVQEKKMFAESGSNPVQMVLVACDQTAPVERESSEDNIILTIVSDDEHLGSIMDHDKVAVLGKVPFGQAESGNVSILECEPLDKLLYAQSSEFFLMCKRAELVD